MCKVHVHCRTFLRIYISIAQHVNNQIPIDAHPIMCIVHSAK